MSRLGWFPSHPYAAGATAESCNDTATDHTWVGLRQVPRKLCLAASAKLNRIGSPFSFFFKCIFFIICLPRYTGLSFCAGNYWSVFGVNGPEILLSQEMTRSSLALAITQTPSPNPSPSPYGPSASHIHIYHMSRQNHQNKMNNITNISRLKMSTLSSRVATFREREWRALDLHSELTDWFFAVEVDIVHTAQVAGQSVQDSLGDGIPHVHKSTQ